MVVDMEIVAVLKNQAAHMKDILALQLIHWLDIASLKDLAAKENLPSVRVWRRKVVRRKIAAKSKTFRNFKNRLIIPYRIQIKGRDYGLFRILTNEEFGVDKLKYL